MKIIIIWNWPLLQSSDWVRVAVYFSFFFFTQKEKVKIQRRKIRTRQRYHATTPLLQCFILFTSTPKGSQSRNITKRVKFFYTSSLLIAVPLHCYLCSANNFQLPLWNANMSWIECVLWVWVLSELSFSFFTKTTTTQSNTWAWYFSFCNCFLCLILLLQYVVLEFCTVWNP